MTPMRGMLLAALTALAACNEGGNVSRERGPLPVARALALANVTVVDVRKGVLLPKQTVLIKDGSIAAVGPQGLAVPPDAQMIDLQDRFLVPGYNDMHAHPLGHDDDPAGTFALMLANGVTGFRQMQGSDALLEMRRAGTLPLTLDAPALLALPGPLLTPFNAGSTEDARETVRAQKAAGADFIKVGLVSSEMLPAVLDEARRSKLPVAGHVPSGSSVVAAAQGGFRSIEHLGPGNADLVACSTEEDALRAAAPSVPLKAPPFKIPFADRLVTFLLKDKIINPAVTVTEPEHFTWMYRLVSSFDEAKCRKVAAALVAAGNWQVPTLIRARSSQLAFERGFADDPNLRYLAPATIDRWKKITAKYEEALDPDRKVILRKLYDTNARLLKIFEVVGVKLMAGSDACGAGWLVPGFALHREFDELAGAGLSPLRVLQMATLDPAEFLGGSDRGTVEAGRAADLVVLEANPLVSVQNLHQIHAVIRAGHYRSRSDLDALLGKVESAPITE
jgi:imidazolonepropionase-like amidohydrolase